MAKVTGKPSSKKTKRKVEHVRVEAAANKGFIVHHRLAPAPRPASKAAAAFHPGYEPDPDPAAFEDHEGAMAHVGNLMSQMHGGDAGGPEPAEG